jgi:hypothetical protein
MVEKCRRDSPAPERVERGLDEPTAEAGARVMDGCGRQRREELLGQGDAFE